MKSTHWVLIVSVGVLSALTACTKEPEHVPRAGELVRRSVTYPDPAEQKLFRDALASASIPYELTMGPDGKEYVAWAGDQDSAVEAVKVRLFGEDLPTGRNIRFSGEYGDQFKTWLTANAIPFRIVTKHGKEYVVWEDQDSPRVAKWPHFPANYWPDPSLLQK
jgi:hypothetical protein